MASFKFTEEELTHIKRAAQKLMDIRKDLPPKDWKKPQNKIARELHAKFSMDADEYILSRNIIRALLQLTKAGSSALVTTVKEYERRLQTQPDKVEFYTPYLEKAKKMQAVFAGLTEKLEGGL